MRSSGMPSNSTFMSSDRIHRHAGLADVGESARMIRVVAAMGGQVERHRQTLLAGGDIAPVKCVALLGRGKAGVLAHGPWLGDIHRAVRPAQEGRDTRHGVQVLALLEVLGGIERLQIDLFERFVRPFFERLAGLLFKTRAPFVEATTAGRAVEGTCVKSGMFSFLRPPRSL